MNLQDGIIYILSINTDSLMTKIRDKIYFWIKYYLS